ncbi:phosphodiesterase [Corynebacterium phocae]|nr:phosphodiesterase [Corynebacterium phocae]
MGAATAGGAALAASGISLAHNGQQRLSPLEAYNQSTGAELPFLHGVASGDPLPTSVVLWTRVTPERDALPGSGLGEDIELEWEVSQDPEFRSLVSTGTVTASAREDHTVHVDPFGLEPGEVYFYRFRTLNGALAGAVSPVGRTKTAPAFDADVRALSFAIASCANYESGYFCAYLDMAQRAQAGDIDLVVFLGDYIYEYASGEYAGKSGIARPHHPSWEIVTLEDYRIRYGRYRTDSHLQAAHAAAPWVVTWDDHESANDSWRAGAENHTDGEVEGTWPKRYSQALQAYLEWMPVRAAQVSEQGHLYRSFRFGQLMELTMMDLRSYRDAHLGGSERTMMGSEQFQWVSNILATTPARWAVLGNSVMIGPMRILTLPGNEDANAAITAIRASTTGNPINLDQWDGFDADRRRLLEQVAARDGNTLFVTGDIHSEWANSIRLDGKEVAAEVVTTSISAPNIDEILTSYTGIYHPEDNSTSLLVEDAIRGANPTVKHLDYDAHGYAVVEMEPDVVNFSYLRVSNVEDPQATVYVGAEKTWVPGRGFTQ